MRIIILTSIYLFIIKNLYSQNSLNFQQVDNKTYQYYLNTQWDSLIYLGEEAIKQQIDYYYLRLRLGLAYYKKQSYCDAIKNLKIAYEFNSTDPFLLELLYYSYLFSNQLSEANYFLKTHISLLKQLHHKDPLVKMIYIESGMSSMNKNENTIIEKQKNNNNTNIKWLESNKIENVKYTALGGMFTFNKNILSTFSYGNINNNIVKEIWIGNDILDDRYSLHQHQIYFNSIFRLSSGKYIIPSINLILVNYETLFSRYNKNENKVYLDRNLNVFYDYATSLTYRRRYPKIEFDINVSLSKLNQNYQSVFSTIFTFYPKGNLNFYFSTSASMQFQNKTNNLIFDEKIGLKLLKRLWIEQFATFGKLTNYVEQNAYVVNNTFDISNFRAGTQLIVPIQKFRISARYLISLKSSPFEYYDTKLRYDKTNYIEHNVLINLSWWF